MARSFWHPYNLLPFLYVLSLAATVSAVLERVCKGNYNVILDNLGPRPGCLRPIEVPDVETEPIELPPVQLPFALPPPRTIQHKCRCVKTLVRAQPVLQVIRVPVVRRYVQTISRPVKEIIAYRARPSNVQQCRPCF